MSILTPDNDLKFTYWTWYKPVLDKADTSIPLRLFWWSTSVIIIWYYFTSYETHPPQRSFFNIVLGLFTFFVICMWIHHYIRHDHESSGFRKLAEKQMDISNCVFFVVVVFLQFSSHQFKYDEYQYCLKWTVLF